MREEKLFCDRCKNEIKTKNFLENSIKLQLEGKIYEICLLCKKEILNFMVKVYK